MYKMVDIAVEKHTDVKVHTIRLGNKKLFWVKMCDAQARLGVGLVRKEIWGTFEKILQRIKLESTKESKKIR